MGRRHVPPPIIPGPTTPITTTTTTNTRRSSQAPLVQRRKREGGRVHQCLPPVHQYENERDRGGRKNLVGTNLCTGRSSRSIEGECIGRKTVGGISSGNSRRIVHKNEGEVQGV